MTLFLLVVMIVTQAQSTKPGSSESASLTTAEIQQRLDQLADAQQRSREELEEIRKEIAQLRNTINTTPPARLAAKSLNAVSIEQAQK